MFCAFRGVTARHGEPLPLEVFAEYGTWFARNAVPVLDERTVTRVAPRAGGFEVVTEDGRSRAARTVAPAVGLLPFAQIPAALRGLPPALVSHSGDHAALDGFRDRDVTVVGAGQSSLETAALLAEQGTRVRLLARAGRLRWDDVPAPLERPWWRAARSPRSALGPGRLNRFHAGYPGLHRRLPEGARSRLAATASGPRGAWWLRERVERGVEVLLGHDVLAAYEVPGGLRLKTASRDGAVRVLDTGHVIAATGFRATRDRLRPLSPDLRALLATGADGAPEAGPDFASSYPGLFLAGPVTCAGFGPAMRSVQGAAFTAATLVRGVRRRLHTGPAGWPVPPARTRATRDVPHAVEG